MKNAYKLCILMLLCLTAVLISLPLLAQDEELEDVDRDRGPDTDEIMETDDALSQEAKMALEKKQIDELLDGVEWLGHSAFLIQNDVVIYIDPFEIPDNLPAADVILVTHGHADHLSPDDIKKILKPSTKVVTTEAARSSLPEEAKNVIIVKPGKSIEVDGIRIDVVPAYNRNKDYHPKKRGDAGYVIHLPDRTIYHAGDTDFIDEMKTIKTDVALLPVGGKYTMDAAEAAQAANAIRPRVAVPMHWGKIIGSRKDAEAFVAACEVPAVILDIYSPPAPPETGKK
jgi:L-ascorbate metabolism protein UlaG (beta-lactamase superfamily)